MFDLQESCKDVQRTLCIPHPKFLLMLTSKHYHGTFVKNKKPILAYYR